MSTIAFAETAYYDSVISNYLNFKSNNHFPKKKTVYGNLIEKFVMENPHQEAALYSQGDLPFNKLHGKQLSYNNYNDIFSALTISKNLKKYGYSYSKTCKSCGYQV